MLKKIVPMAHKHSNALINESSPYLLQHAHNPVNWHAWDTEILKRAKKENKLLLISIGYAACHWCHVMEEECFEDEEVAQIMNKYFINIKIDREERPDVDHIYMDALQMMTGSGGWPLNIVALPDGKPFWGATYVKKRDWTRVLIQLATMYRENPEKIMEYAQNMAEGIKAINLVEPKTDPTQYSMALLDEAVKTWATYFDTFLGGYKRAPKFMMPTNLDFLLHYGMAKQDKAIMDYVNVTLTKMAHGGVFDQVGGGFSRYAVDTKWHVPHFEKMLYDNGQLISLYSKAYATTKNELYAKTVQQTIAFVTHELMDSNFAFYASLDADSLNENGELEEGAYYVWTSDSLKKILKNDYEVFKEYYNINSYGHWEHGNYVLIRDKTDTEIAKKHNLTVDQLTSLLDGCKKLLHVERNKRARPRLDDKILTSWNGLMLKGLIDAYRYLGSEDYLDIALKNAAFIRSTINEDGQMFHSHKNGKSTINGYLEDYATIIDAFIGLYEVTFDEKWLFTSKKLTDYCLDNFLDDKSGMFFFTSKKDDFVIRRTIETRDNVIPSSNSIMAKNLFKLSKIFPGEKYGETSRIMVGVIQDHFKKNAQSYANWLHLAFYPNTQFYEVAIVGKENKEKAKQLMGHYMPNAIFMGTEKESNLPLLQNKHVKDSTHIYVCVEGSCKLPVEKPTEALEQMGLP